MQAVSYRNSLASPRLKSHAVCHAHAMHAVSIHSPSRRTTNYWTDRELEPLPVLDKKKVHSFLVRAECTVDSCNRVWTRSTGYTRK